MLKIFILKYCKNCKYKRIYCFLDESSFDLLSGVFVDFAECDYNNTLNFSM